MTHYLYHLLETRPYLSLKHLEAYRFWLKRAVLTCLVLSPGISLTAAQTASDTALAETIMESLSNILQITTFVDANVQFCSEKAPSALSSAEAAAQSWRAKSGLESLDRLRDLSPETYSNLETALKQETLATLYDRAFGRELEWCNNLSSLLQSSDWDMQTKYASELATLNSFVTRLSDEHLPDVLPNKQTLNPITSPNYPEVLALGINPEVHFIPDEFRCYMEKDGDDYKQPDMIVQILAAGLYQSSYGGGRYELEKDAGSSPDVEWLSGPLTGARSFLRYDDFGQYFRLSSVELGDKSYSYWCYQQGASEQHALTKFRLGKPQPGSYSCQNVETGNVQSLELLPDFSYHLAGQAGTYQITELFENDSSSRIKWLTGPLADESSSYSEEADTGYREFSLSISESSWGFSYSGVAGGSSSQLSVLCYTVAEPVSFQRYGDDPVPPAPASDVALSGLYYRYESEFNGMYSSNQPAFYLFFPNGYVHTGDIEADPATIDCQRSKPNGQPFCESYIVQGNTIFIGDNDPEPFRLEAGIPVLDGEPMNPVVAGVTSLNGDFWANYFSQFGICGAFSICSSNYREWKYSFSADGGFAYESSGKNLASSQSDFGSVFASDNSFKAQTGRYSIAGHVLELRFDNGKVEKHFFAYLEEDSFVIGNRWFTLKKPDEE